MRHHAFIDESARPGRYLLTAALVPSHELTVVTRQVKELFPRGTVGRTCPRRASNDGVSC